MIKPISILIYLAFGSFFTPFCINFSSYLFSNTDIPVITIRNDTNAPICSVNLEDPSSFPPSISTSGGLLFESIGVGKEVFFSVDPGTYDVYVLDCEDRLVFEKNILVTESDLKIYINEPSSGISIQNHSDKPLCFFSWIKLNQNKKATVYSWSKQKLVSANQIENINTVTGNYDLQVSNCEGQKVFSSENLELLDNQIINVEIGPSGDVEFKYDKDALSVVCFLYINEINNESLGEDYLSYKPLLPNETVEYTLPEGRYNATAKDCYDNIIFQKGNIEVRSKQKLSIDVPYPNSSLSFNVQSKMDVCGLYISNNIDDFKGYNFSEKISEPIFLREGYYDIQVDFCEDYVYDKIYTTKVYKNFYISKEYEFTVKDPRLWIVQFVSEFAEKNLRILCIGFCGLLLLSFVIIFLTIRWIIKTHKKPKRNMA